MKKIKFLKLSSLFTLGIATAITPILVGTSCGVIDQPSSSDSTQPDKPSDPSGTTDPGTSQPSDPGTQPSQHNYFYINKDNTLTGLTPDGKQQTKLKIPSTVKIIAAGAFQDCTNLKQINLGTVWKIDNDAFSGCTSLTNISLPSTVTSLGGGVFNGCVSLKSLLFANNLKIKEIRYNTFLNCSSLESVNIPYGVQSIGTDAFHGCKVLKSITIPNSVEFIYDKAFYDCELLENLVFSDNLLTIKSSAFENCKSLKNIKIPDRVSIIWDKAFAGCKSLETVILPKNLISLSGSAFWWCPETTTYYVANNDLEKIVQPLVAGKVVVGSGPTNFIKKLTDIKMNKVVSMNRAI